VGVILQEGAKNKKISNLFLVSNFFFKKKVRQNPLVDKLSNRLTVLTVFLQYIYRKKGCDDYN